MPFIRVKSSDKNDAQHEFDVSTVEYEANKSLYTVVDKEPYAEARPVKYVEAEPATQTKSGGATKKGRA